MLKEESGYIRDLSTGNHKAFDYLFLQYYPKVNYFIQHIVKSREAAKDLSQDIFEKIWINREQISQVESFNSYIFRMAKNSALNYLEHLQIKSEYETSYQYHDNKLSIEEEIDIRDLELLIKLVVESMPAQRKKIFKLSREQYLKNKEIADMLNISEKTVKNHLTLALKEIREAILVALLIFFHFN
ncbi:RNA polymerase sigma-70 factor [Dysgonomonas reticulitermitis]|nr:DNA-directed RNA polymerase sigma-70 factor [Bacteroidia bacterium]